MKALEFINSLSDLEMRIDALPSLDSKLEMLGAWLVKTCKLKTALIFDFVSHKAIGPDLDSKKADVETFLRTLSGRPGVVEPAPEQLELLAPAIESEFVHYPLRMENGLAAGALLLFAAKPRDFFNQHGNAVKIVADKVRDLFIIERLELDPRPRPAAPPEPAAAPNLGDRPSASNFIQLMNFPMFIIQSDGELVAVNNSFLVKLKYPDASEFMRRGDAFRDLFSRGELLASLKKEGGLRNRRISLHDALGERVTVNLSAVGIGDLIVGSLFDVSEYVKVTDDLRESLKMQEFLNDKLISAALLLHKTQSSAIRSLARLAEFRDHETGDHLQRICEYSRLISQEVFKRQPFDFKIRSEYCDDIFLSSMLHDIGKVGIPDQILLKKGKLDADEWKIMKSHTVIGWTILNQADCELGEQSFLTLASQIALNHHERWDGTGYPYGLKTDKIPLSARISAVADVYDALTSQRPYKKPWHHEDAVNEIKTKSEVSFDPAIVDIFMSVEKKLLDIHYQFPR